MPFAAARLDLATLLHVGSNQPDRPRLFSEVARAFFSRMQAQMAGKEPPVVGLPLLMGEAAATKVANMMAAVQGGDIQPAG